MTTSTHSHKAWTDKGGHVTSLLCLEDLTNRLTVITLNAVPCPDQMPRLRALLEDLTDALESCEQDPGTCWCRFLFALDSNCKWVLRLQSKKDNLPNKAPQKH
ncbi:hypothetical protein KBY76_12845 [Synechococcus sp. GreenBA-s]|nr:hypothetical protein [Synechococcus sp. GreenBA-s]